MNYQTFSNNKTILNSLFESWQPHPQLPSIKITTLESFNLKSIVNQTNLKVSPWSLLPKSSPLIKLWTLSTSVLINMLSKSKNKNSELLVKETNVKANLKTEKRKWWNSTIILIKKKQNLIVIPLNSKACKKLKLNKKPSSTNFPAMKSENLILRFWFLKQKSFIFFNQSYTLSRIQSFINQTEK